MSEKTSSSGISFGALLFLAFLVLKLCRVIDWSWWWVTAPLWIPLALVLIIFMVCGILVGIAEKYPGNPKSQQSEQTGKSRWQQRYEQMLESEKRLKNRQ